jgi:hypothetical protein
VGEFLEGRLHTNVPLRRDIVSADKQFLHPVGYLAELLQRPDAGDAVHEFVGIEALVLRDSLEASIDFHQFIVVEDIFSDKGDPIERLNAAGAPSNNADRAGGGDGGQRRVADLAGAGLVVNALIEVRERTPLLGKLLGHFPGFGAYKTHHFSRELHRLL